MRRLARIRSQAGVAMATVMLVGTALTALTSTAVFVTVHELRSGTDDRKAVEALAYAEAGIDRFVDYIRSGRVTYGTLRRAGCEDPPLPVPLGGVGSGASQGTFDAEVTVFDPNAVSAADRLPPVACAARGTARQGGYFRITSKGEHPTAKRVVQQIVRIRTVNLPIGISADYIDSNGTPDMTGISMVAPGRIIGRGKLDFEGVDPYYKLEDFYPGHTWTSGRSGTDPMPAAAHAVGGIWLGNPGPKEFPPNPNCNANKSGGTQSLWDSDGSAASGPIATGCAGQVGLPPTTKFTQADFDRVAPKKLDPQDRALFKAAAKASGHYCYIPLSGPSYCIQQGTQIPYTTDVSGLLAAGTNNFIAYFEFEGGDPLDNEIRFRTSVWGCNDDPALNKSMVLFVENGGLEMEANTQVNGALILDGAYKYTGTPWVNGTIIASEFWIRGTATFSLDSCWVRNLPGPFLGVTPGQWSELDR
jgi:hypothetical protein